MDCHKEFKSDLLHFLVFCATQTEKVKILQRIYALISTLPPRNVIFEAQYLVQYYIQRGNNFTMY